MGVANAVRLHCTPGSTACLRALKSIDNYADGASLPRLIEQILLLKLYALPSLYRQGNFARVSIYETDIATLMHDYQPDPELLFSELTKHLSDTDLISVREIVSDIQHRIARFDSRRSS
jgi:hypothetical protein